MRQYVQLDIFGGHEVVCETEGPKISKESLDVIKSCAGLSEWEQTKKLMLCRNYQRNEIKRYFGLFEYPTLVQAITKYNESHE